MPRFQSKPHYPIDLRAREQGGTVLIGFVVDRAGETEEVRVLESTNIGFNQSAMNSVDSWKFRLGEKDGVTVAVALKVPVLSPKN